MGRAAALALALAGLLGPLPAAVGRRAAPLAGRRALAAMAARVARAAAPAAAPSAGGAALPSRRHLSGAGGGEDAVGSSGRRVLQGVAGQMAPLASHPLSASGFTTRIFRPGENEWSEQDTLGSLNRAGLSMDEINRRLRILSRAIEDPALTPHMYNNVANEAAYLLTQVLENFRGRSPVVERFIQRMQDHMEMATANVHTRSQPGMHLTEDLRTWAGRAVALAQRSHQWLMANAAVGSLQEDTLGSLNRAGLSMDEINRRLRILSRAVEDPALTPHMYNNVANEAAYLLTQVLEHFRGRSPVVERFIQRMQDHMEMAMANVHTRSQPAVHLTEDLKTWAGRAVALAQRSHQWLMASAAVDSLQEYTAHHHMDCISQQEWSKLRFDFLEAVWDDDTAARAWAALSPLAEAMEQESAGGRHRTSEWSRRLFHVGRELEELRQDSGGDGDDGGLRW